MHAEIVSPDLVIALRGRWHTAFDDILFTYAVALFYALLFPRGLESY